MNSEQLAALADLWEARAIAAIDDARASTAGVHTGTVDLYLYSTEADFDKAGGQARYGVDWATHSLLAGQTVKRLRARGFDARLTPFTGALHEPANLHEPAADERTGQ